MPHGLSHCFIFSSKGRGTGFCETDAPAEDGDAHME